MLDQWSRFSGFATIDLEDSPIFIELISWDTNGFYFRRIFNQQWILDIAVQRV